MAPRVGTRGRRRRRAWQPRGLVALVLSGLLLSVGVLLGQAVPWKDARSPVPQVGPQSHVVVVQDDTLPPVMQRIAQCESWGQHLTREGKVLRGKRNPQDLGLFQINAVVWTKKAEELGYDIRTRDGNAHMARYIFENYGSVPWHASAKCWSRVS
jgi:hypothetical protein